MEAVAALKDTAIPVIFQPTLDIFRPLLESNRSEIENIKRTTYKYGYTERHQLDVYYPPDSTKTKDGKAPVLFFVYGGGFFEGQRILPKPYDLGYTSTGAYFAKQGVVTIIADYRLVPHIKFPEPVEDLRDAFAWFVSHAGEIFSDSGIQPDLNHIFWMGHSAGAAHISTLLLYPGLLPDDLRMRIRGLILKGGAYRHSPGDGMDEIVVQYYNSWDASQKNMPISLLENAPEEILKNFPNVLLFASEREPEGIWPVNDEFSSALKKKFKRDYSVIPMKGHNHISPHWALFSGQGEQWAEDVSNWVHGTS